MAILTAEREIPRGYDRDTKGMMNDQQNGKLSAIRCRHPAYGIEEGGGGGIRTD